MIMSKRNSPVNLFKRALRRRLARKIARHMSSDDKYTRYEAGAIDKWLFNTRSRSFGERENRIVSLKERILAIEPSLGEIDVMYMTDKSGDVYRMTVKRL